MNNISTDYYYTCGVDKFLSGRTIYHPVCVMCGHIISDKKAKRIRWFVCQECRDRMFTRVNKYLRKHNNMEKELFACSKENILAE